MSATEASREKRVAVLDGLRGVSILLVLVGHLAGTRGFIVHDQMPHVTLLANFGVRVFFVISGYLITGILLKARNASALSVLGSFYVRRFFRIVPPFGLYLGSLWLLFAFGVLGPFEAIEWRASFLYVSNFVQIDTWELGHLWSLAVEEQFYLAWPLVLIAAGARKAGFFAAAFCVAGPVIRAAWLSYSPGEAYLLTTAFPFVGDAIAVGCLLALDGEIPRIRRFRDRLLGSPLMMVVPVAALWPVTLGAHPRIYQYVGVTVANVGIALCLSWLLEKPRSIPARVLATSIPVFVGRMSYSLYLWQQVFLQRQSDAEIRAFPWNVLAASLAVWVSFSLVERPAQAAGHRLDRRWFGSRSVPVGTERRASSSAI